MVNFCTYFGLSAFYGIGLNRKAVVLWNNNINLEINIHANDLSNVSLSEEDKIPDTKFQDALKTVNMEGQHGTWKEGQFREHGRIQMDSV